MKVARKIERSSTRRARLGAYLATGVGAIGIGTSAEAGVISIDLTGYTADNLGLANGGFGLFYFIPGNTIFAVSSYSGNTGLSLQSPNGGGILATTGNGVFDTPINNGPGVVVGPSSGSFVGSYLPTVFKNSLRTVSDFGPNSFLGFKTAAGRYGYIEVLWTASTNTFKLVSAAYESDVGVAIQTPSGAPVPEPASGAVVALLMGGTALRQWRKKRQASQEACNEGLAS